MRNVGAVLRIGGCAARAGSDPAPLSVRQLGTLSGAVGRELLWGQRLVRREVRVWRRRAQQIPDPLLRADALRALRSKRHYADGAALFWILPDRRDPDLLRLLVDFQIAANFLDVVSERGAVERGACGGRLMHAFVDAVDLDAAPEGDYYAGHQQTDDGGYLVALVGACRTGCRSLPRYGQAHDLLVGEARRARALELGHDPDPRRRDAALKRFATAEDEHGTGAPWFEQTAGAASAMTVIVLLALAATGEAQAAMGNASAVAGQTQAAGGQDVGTPGAREGAADLAAAVGAYRWVAALSTMLDSYVDRAEDLASGDWSMIAAYADEAAAAERIGVVIDRALRDVAVLPDGERHTLLVSAMTALFLSRDSARDHALAARTRSITHAGGTLTRLLVPVLRLWRTLRRERAV